MLAKGGGVEQLNALYILAQSVAVEFSNDALAYFGKQGGIGWLINCKRFNWCGLWEVWDEWDLWEMMGEDWNNSGFRYFD